MRIWCLLWSLQLLGGVLVEESFEMGLPGGDWRCEAVDLDHSRVKSGEASLRLSAVGDRLQTPYLTTAGILEFWVAGTNSTTELSVEWVVNGVVTEAAVYSGFTADSFQLIRFNCFGLESGRLQFRKTGYGSVFIDDLVVTDGLGQCVFEWHQSEYTAFIPVDKRAVVCGAFFYHTAAPSLDFDLSFVGDGLANFNNYRLYHSANHFYEPGWDLLVGEGRVVGGDVIFDDNEHVAEQTGYLLVVADSEPLLHSVDFALSPAVTECIVKSEEQPLDWFEGLRNETKRFKFVANALVDEFFADAKLNTGQVWFGDLGAFVVEPASWSETLGFQGGTMTSRANYGSHQLLTRSSMLFGTWEVAVHHNSRWDLSAKNHYYLILAAETDSPTNLQAGQFDFDGYYLKFENQLSLYRQNGKTSHLLDSAGWPVLDNRGLELRIVHSFDGLWQVFLQNDDLELELLRTNDKHVITPVYMGIVNKIGNPADYRVNEWGPIKQLPLAVEEPLPEVVSGDAEERHFWQVIFDSLCTGRVICQKEIEPGLWENVWVVDALEEVKQVVVGASSTTRFRLFYERMGYPSVLLAVVKGTPSSCEVRLVTGWNLIALPWAESVGFLGDEMVCWHQTEAGYASSSHLLPGYGHWLYWDQPSTVFTLEGVAETLVRPDFWSSVGWQLRGGVDSTMDESQDVFCYDGVLKQYQRKEAREVKSGEGFWIWQAAVEDVNE